MIIKLKQLVCSYIYYYYNIWAHAFAHLCDDSFGGGEGYKPLTPTYYNIRIFITICLYIYLFNKYFNILRIGVGTYYILLR